MVHWLNNGVLTEQWCANFLIIDKAFWVLDLESIVLYHIVAMSNILQSSLSSCWRVLLQTFLSPDSTPMRLNPKSYQRRTVTLSAVSNSNMASFEKGTTSILYPQLCWISRRSLSFYMKAVDTLLSTWSSTLVFANGRLKKVNWSPSSLEATSDGWMSAQVVH